MKSNSYMVVVFVLFFGVCSFVMADPENKTEAPEADVSSDVITNKIDDQTVQDKDKPDVKVPTTNTFEVSDEYYLSDNRRYTAGSSYDEKEKFGILGRGAIFFDIGAAYKDDDEGLYDYYLGRYDIDRDMAPHLSLGFNLPLIPQISLEGGVGYMYQSGKICYQKAVPYTRYVRSQRYVYINGRPYIQTRIQARTTYHYFWTEEKFEIHSISGNLGLMVNLLPGKPVNPYVRAGGYYVNQEVKVEGESESDGDGGFFVGGGVELMPHSNV